MRASQRKMSSSEMGPAVMPSGGAEARVLYSWKRRREAMLEAIFAVRGREIVGRKEKEDEDEDEFVVGDLVDVDEVVLNC